ncbi:MAG: hypothetical protein WC367_08885, partial [Methanoregula sp.]
MIGSTAGKFTGAVVLVLLFCIAAAGAAGDPGPAPSATPAVYLDFNEGSGNAVLDASGHGNTGTIVGSVRRVDNSWCVKALVLDGNADYVVIPHT